MIVPDRYRFLLDSYTGQGGFFDGSYLIKHPRESDEKYERRKALAVYPNYVKKVVKAYLGHLLKVPPQREKLNEVYNMFLQNADRKGTYFDDVAKKAMLLSMIMGVCFTVVDKPEERALTRAEEFEKRLFPYVVLKKPDAVAVYKTDELGLSMISFRETDEQGILRYRVFTRDAWIISSDPEGRQVLKKGEHGLGVVPVVPLYSMEVLEDDIFGTPWILDIAELNFDLFNALSELRELLRSQTFSILAFPARDAGEAAKLKDITLSTENALPYNPEAGGKPDFISPPEGPVRLYLEYIEKIIQHIYRIAGIEFLGTEAKSGKSGVAFSFMFQEMDSVLQGWAGALEEWEYRIAELVCRWEGETFEGNITYNKRFNLVDLAQEIKNALDAITLQISPTFDRELKKRLSRLVLADWGSDEIFEKIDREIDGEDVYRERLNEETA
jgi:hypothetical protein